MELTDKNGTKSSVKNAKYKALVENRLEARGRGEIEGLPVSQKDAEIYRALAGIIPMVEKVVVKKKKKVAKKKKPDKEYSKKRDFPYTVTSRTF